MTLYELLAYLPSAVCAVWCILLLSRIGRDNRAKVFLGIFMAVSFILYFCHALYFTGCYSAAADTLYLTAQLAVYPLFLIYIRYLTSTEGASTKWFAILAIAVVVGTTCWVLYVLMPDEEVAYFTHNYLYGAAMHDCSAAAESQKLFHSITPVIFAAEVVYTLVKGLWLIVAYHRNLKNYYSDQSGRTLYKVRNMLVVLIVFSTLSILVNFLGKQPFAGDVEMLAIPSLIFSTLLFTIGITGYTLRFSAENLYEFVCVDKSDAIPLSETKRAKLYQGIVRLLDNEESFRTKDYKLTEMAAALGTNRSYVSKVINTDFGCNFSDLVNGRRVEYAKKIMRCNTDKPNKALTAEIIEESGFSSESSFYRIFKQQTGLTPVEYRAKVLTED